MSLMDEITSIVLDTARLQVVIMSFVCHVFGSGVLTLIFQKKQPDVAPFAVPKHTSLFPAVSAFPL